MHAAQTTLHRRSIRLTGYDYTQPGAYFVTICTHDRACLFGEVINETMRLNDAGQLVDAIWKQLPRHFPHISLDAHVVMPNHIHGIICINDDRRIADQNPGVERRCEPSMPAAGTHPQSLGAIVQNFKSVASRMVRRIASGQAHVWQRNYYERIIRDDAEMNTVRAYLVENTAKWILDRDNPGMGTAR